MIPNAFSILYVDDDENDLLLVKFAAQTAGMETCLRTANSGAQAIDYLQGYGPFADRQSFPVPKLILLDLRMPRMNGLDVLRWLRSQPEHLGIVVIIFTASAHPDDVKRACEHRANAFVQKPPSHDQLVKFLQTIKTFWGEFHQYPLATSGEALADLAKPELSP